MKFGSLIPSLGCPSFKIDPNATIDKNRNLIYGINMNIHPRDVDCMMYMNIYGYSVVMAGTMNVVGTFNCVIYTPYGDIYIMIEVTDDFYNSNMCDKLFQSVPERELRSIIECENAKEKEMYSKMNKSRSDKNRSRHDAIAKSGNIDADKLCRMVEKYTC